MATFEAVVFDMDGVIVDSEPFWAQAEVEVFNRFGFPMRSDMCVQTMGMRVNEVVDHWFGPSATNKAEIEKCLIDSVIEKVTAEAELMDGVVDALDFFAAQGLRLALASSSYYVMINAVLDAFSLTDRFEVVRSAEDEELGKPHPAVYLTTAAALDVDPTRCIAIEDSANGVKSAKAAGYACIAVPDPAMRNDVRLDVADVQLESLTQLDDVVWRRLQTLDQGHGQLFE